MRDSKPPFLEFGFYFAHIKETEALSNLVGKLVESGAKFTGKGAGHRGEEIRSRRFASPHDLALEPVVICDFEEFKCYVADPEIRLIEVGMTGASAVTQEVVETIGYQSISNEAAEKDCHPLAIRTEGILFSGSARRQVSLHSLKAGKNAYRRFLFLIEELKPSYAAITIEYGLECPSDLRRDARSLAFRNFFVSGSYMEADCLQGIAKLFRDGYVKTVADGLYISSTTEFNPLGKSLDGESSQWKSMEVAQVIASQAEAASRTAFDNA